MSDVIDITTEIQRLAHYRAALDLLKRAGDYEFRHPEEADALTAAVLAARARLEDARFLQGELQQQTIRMAVNALPRVRLEQLAALAFDDDDTGEAA